MSYTAPPMFKRLVFRVTPGLAALLYPLAVYMYVDAPLSGPMWPLWVGWSLAILFALAEAWYMISMEVEGMLMHARWNLGPKKRQSPRWPTPEARMMSTLLSLLFCIGLLWLIEPTQLYLMLALGPASACTSTLVCMIVLTSETEDYERGCLKG